LNPARKKIPVFFNLQFGPESLDLHLSELVAHCKSQKEVSLMKRFLLNWMIAVVLVFPSLVGAASEEDFKVKTTENLIALCSATPDDPLYAQAVNFCHGYLVGAFHYYEASVAGPKGKPLVCLPDPRPSRNEAIALFIDWAKDHPQYWGENPVETEFRFLMEKWPCNP